MLVPVGEDVASEGVDFRDRTRLPAQRGPSDGCRLDPAADAQELHRPRLSATDQITEPMVSSAPITGSTSEA